MIGGRKPKSKGHVIAGLILGTALALCGFGVLLAAALWQERGRKVDDLLVFALFLGCMLLSLAVLFRVLGDAIRVDCEERGAKYEAVPLARLQGLDRERVLDAFLAQGFQEQDGGFLRKKFFSLSKDAIHCFVRWVPVLDVETALAGELQRLARVEMEDPKLRRKCMCAFLFLAKSHSTQADEAALRAASADFLMRETVVPSQVFHTALPILVDEEAGEGRYLDMSTGISVYAHGCRRLKKMFSSDEGSRPCRFR